MNRKGLIKHYADNKIYANLISQKFAPFTIEGSLFRKPNTRSYDLYQLEMETLLSQVSQVSQNGKLGK